MKNISDSVAVSVSDNLSVDQQAVSSPPILTPHPFDDDDVKKITSCESNIESLGLTGFPHFYVRSKAADVYLARTTRQQLAHKAHMQLLQDKCNIGNFVGLPIDKVDRTNTDPRLLPCVIIAKEAEKVKLACVNGIINHWWTLNVLVGLTGVPYELIHLQLDELKEISMITAFKLYVRGAINGTCCSCKGGCKTKQCICKPSQAFCSTKCHRNTSCCKNVEK